MITGSNKESPNHSWEGVCQYRQCANCDYIITPQEFQVYVSTPAGPEARHLVTCPNCGDARITQVSENMTLAMIQDQVACRQLAISTSETEFTNAEISHVAVEVHNARAEAYGVFLRVFFESWQRADPSNQNILRRAASNLIRKYKLAVLFNYEYGVDKGHRVVEECSKCEQGGEV